MRDGLGDEEGSLGGLSRSHFNQKSPWISFFIAIRCKRFWGQGKVFYAAVMFETLSVANTALKATGRAA